MLWLPVILLFELFSAYPFEGHNRNCDAAELGYHGLPDLAVLETPVLLVSFSHLRSAYLEYHHKPRKNCCFNSRQQKSVVK